MNPLHKRILDISYKYNLSHLGSCLTAVDIIDSIYAKKEPKDKFVLSSGHAGLALYVVLEKYGFGDAEIIFAHHGVHPDWCRECHIDCSAGSLGHGLPIALGMALANNKRRVYCLISDGECAEGSIWEALNIFESTRPKNLFLHVNLNGWGAYHKINSNALENTILAHIPSMTDHVFFYRTNVEMYPFLKGQDAHYHVMNKDEYESTIR